MAEVSADPADRTRTGARTGHTPDRDLLASAEGEAKGAPFDRGAPTGHEAARTSPSGSPVGSESRPASLSILPVSRSGAETTGPPDPRRSDVDEWGRSEHMRSIVRRLYDPMYKYWFRVEWEGLEKIPHHGGALLVANHAGAIPSDAPVIMHGIEEELGRPVYGLADYFFRTLPVVGTMWSRTGGVPAHPDNAYRLLHDQQQLALVFPEGTKAHLQDLHRPLPAAPLRPGRVRRDRHAGRRARHPHRRGRGRGVDAHPVPDPQRGQAVEPAVLPGHRQRPADRSPRVRDLLPGQVQAAGPRSGLLRRASPTRTATRRAGSWTRPRPSGPGCRTPSTTCCGSAAASGSADRHGPTGADHRPRHLLGRPDGPGPRARARRRDDPRAGGQRAPGAPGAHRVRPLGPELLHPQPDRPGHPGRHHRAHLPRDQLDQRAQPGPPRDQRHRDHEPAGRGGHGRFVGAPGRGQVLHPRLRGGRDRPDLVP